MSRRKLLKAAQNGELDVVRELVDGGLGVDAANREGTTALIRAAERGRMEVVQFLVDRGADVTAAQANGLTALSRAAFNGHADVVRFLADHGARVDAADDNNWTAVLSASGNGHLEVVRLLVDRGADVNAADSKGWTPLMWAADSNYLDVVRFLIEHNADVDVADEDGSTAVMWAAETGLVEIVKCLVDHEACLTSANNQSTPLHGAAANGHLEIAQLLVDRGADVNAVDNSGLTAAALAAKNGHLEIQRLLTRYTSSYHIARFASKPTTSLISTIFPELLISPFDVQVTQVVDDKHNIGGEFIATWLDADVSVKLFIPDVSNTSFAEEVKMWHQLRHPNVIKLYGACDVGHSFFVCEFASNGSVVEYLAASDVGLERPWTYLHHAALGLSYLHERSIIHGNLRGSSILIGSDGLGKLANFGLSGSFSHDQGDSGYASTSAEDTRGFVGSMRWQAPELLKGGKPSFAADVYALGLCVVEVISGKLPWSEHDEYNVKVRKKLWQSGGLDEGWREPFALSDYLRRLLKTLCCQNPADRDSASTCARMIEQMAQQEKNHVRQQGMQPEAEPMVEISEYESGEISRLWESILNLRAPYSNIGASTTELHKLVLCDLQGLIDQFQQSPRPFKEVVQLHKLLCDVNGFIESSSQSHCALQLSSTRVIGENMLAFQARVAEFKSLYGYQVDVANINIFEAKEIYTQSEQLQPFVSELSSNWKMLQKLGTSEERLNFFSCLHCEIHQRSSKYSLEQLDSMTQTYNDIKKEIVEDAGETDNHLLVTPEWFVPPYELIEDKWDTLGVGGFGSVCRAKWLDSDVVVKRLVADARHTTNDSAQTTESSTFQSFLESHMKTVQSVRTHSGGERLAREQARSMFQHEVDIWFHLSHPHVVRLFGACHVGQPVFVCEYASNGSLDRYLAQHPDEIWAKLREAALGLLYLHERNVVHCDLKCNNIVVGSDNKAKVTDFGLSSAAKIHENVDEQNGKHITGAWNWLAPELMLGETAVPTRESDVFSFGMCVVEALRVVEASHVVPDKRDRLPPRVPWQHLDKSTVKVRMRRHELPLRPSRCTDTQWELVKKMIRYNPSERIPMCVVVDELAGLKKLRGCERIVFEEPKSMATTIDMLTLASSMRADLKYKSEKIIGCASIVGSQDALCSVHELLWSRIENVHQRVSGDPGATERLQNLAIEAYSASKLVHSSSDETFLTLTDMMLRAYGLHRRLDKLMAAAFVTVFDEEQRGVNDWKRRCYELLGVDAGLVAELHGFC